MVTCVLPLLINALSQRIFGAGRGSDLQIGTKTGDSCTTIQLNGAATAPNVGLAILSFREAIAGNKNIAIDMSGVHAIDARVFGLLLMVSKRLKEYGKNLYFSGISSYTKRAFKLHRFEFLLREAS